MTYPILEHDPAREAFIEPSRLIKERDMPQHCVICFFSDVIEKVVAEHDGRVLVTNRWEDGPHPLYEISYRDQRLAFYHPGIGSALSAALLEEVIAFGCRKFIACGGCGVLEEGMAAGMMAVAQFRDVPFGQLLYAGDDLSGPEWDNRGWQRLLEVREQLFWLAADAVLLL